VINVVCIVFQIIKIFLAFRISFPVFAFHNSVKSGFHNFSQLLRQDDART